MKTDPSSISKIRLRLYKRSKIGQVAVRCYTLFGFEVKSGLTSPAGTVIDKYIMYRLG